MVLFCTVVISSWLYIHNTEKARQQPIGRSSVAYAVVKTKPEWMFRKPFQFEGRITRTEYAFSYLLFLIVPFLVFMLFGGMNFQLSLAIGIWFMFAQGAKRCHDCGISGWWILVPFYGVWILFSEGSIGRNIYGHNPDGLSYYFENKWASKPKSRNLSGIN